MFSKNQVRLFLIEFQCTKTQENNKTLVNKVMYCNNCTESNEVSTKTVSTTCTSSTPVENCAKQGNGYAKITYLGNN